MTTKTTKSEAKFTQGGWNRNIPPASKYNCIFAGRNTHVAYLATSGLSEKEIEANCNLIKSAPDLYEALLKAKESLLGMKEMLNSQGMAYGLGKTFMMIENALSKAEGKEMK